MFVLPRPRIYVLVNAVFSFFFKSPVVWERLEGVLTSSCLCNTLSGVHYWYCYKSFQHFKYFGCHWHLLASSLRCERRGRTLSQVLFSLLHPHTSKEVDGARGYKRSVQLTLVTTVSVEVMRQDSLNSRGIKKMLEYKG